MNRIEVNTQTGVETIVPMTEEEIAEHEARVAEFQAALAAETERVAAKQAVLDRLGLTAEEAALLLS
jgi:hypothetical protein